MDGLRQYLIAVTASAIICGIAKSISDEKTVSGAVTRMVAGLIMAITVLSPVMQLEIGQLPVLSFDLMEDAKEAAAIGESMAAAEVNEIINRQLEAYILDKAADYGADLEVELLMLDNSTGQIRGVILRGSVSPYVKAQLQRIIAQDLNIAKEDQQWIR